MNKTELKKIELALDVLTAALNGLKNSTMNNDIADPNYDRGARGRPRSDITREVLDLGVAEQVVLNNSGLRKRLFTKKVANVLKYASKVTGGKFSRRVVHGGVAVTRVA